MDDGRRERMVLWLAGWQSFPTFASPSLPQYINGCGHPSPVLYYTLPAVGVAGREPNVGTVLADMFVVAMSHLVIVHAVAMFALLTCSGGQLCDEGKGRA